jgi:dTDP-4-amino-4,6-dideoxygalactose transaminase
MWRVPLSTVEYGDEEIDAIKQVFGRRWLAMGAETEAFEQEFADFVGVKHAVAICNGTAALHLAFLVLDLGPGDQIIQPAMNFVAAANTTVHVGGEPSFADIISLDEPTIDPAQVEQLIGPRTKAVLVMHYGGYPCRMNDIAAICKKHNLFLIEDACHAVGSSYSDSQDGRNCMVGNLGDIACFSFYANKNLAIGEGGMVTTNDDRLAERLRVLRVHGMTTSSWQRKHMPDGNYDVTEHGYNYRLDDLRSAIGRIQLAKLRENNGQRKNLVTAYRRQLKELDGWIVPFRDYPGDSAYHLMAILAPDRASRSQMVSTLNADGVQTSLHYPCVTELKAFESYNDKFQLPLSREFGELVITLPLFPSLTGAELDDVCRIICKMS